MDPSVASVLAFAVIFAAAGAWELRRPQSLPGQGAARRWRVNIGLFALSSGTMVLFAAVSAAVLPVWYSAANAGAPPATGWHSIAIFLALDATYYGLHRVLHMVGVLWRFHAVHHTDLELDVSSALRHHPGEALLTGAVAGAIAPLLGATAAEISGFAALGFAVQVIAHANIALPPRLVRILERFIVTPDFHRRHHGRDAEFYNSNFGHILTLWDRVFRTASPIGRAGPSDYGVDLFLKPSDQGLGSVLRQPFRNPR